MGPVLVPAAPGRVPHIRAAGPALTRAQGAAVIMAAVPQLVAALTCPAEVEPVAVICRAAVAAHTPVVAAADVANDESGFF